MRPCNLNPQIRDRFLLGKASREERSLVLHHVLAGCDACREQLGSVLVVNRSAAVANGGKGDAGHPAWERIASDLEARRAEIEEEQHQADVTLAEFLTHPRERQRLMVRNSRRLDTPSFCTNLLETAFTAMYDDPRVALDLAEMSLEIALRLDETRFSETVRIDVQGRAWRHVGNARRALGDLAGASMALRNGRACVEAGSGDPLEEGEQLVFESSLLRAQRKLEEAIRLARRARRVYREIQDPHLEGYALIAEAAVYSVMEQFEEAAKRNRLAVAKVDSNRDRHLALAAIHNLVWTLQGAGQVDLARAELAAALPMYRELGDRAILLRLAWLQGRLHRHGGDVAAAEASYREAIAGFAELELPYEVARISLDLAGLMTEQTRVSELKKLAAEMLALFRGLGVAREAIAVWMLFKQATEAETLTLAMIEKFARYYAEARRNPAARFDIPS
jgi:tetratricopeptide (TPR) repeat protein